MRVVVTGAGGFVGTALVGQLTGTPGIETIGVDMTRSPGVAVVGNFADPQLVDAIAADQVDVLVHLAAVPGGAAERDPELSRRVNLDATLSLFEQVTRSGSRPRIVYASTVAVLGEVLPDPVTDATPPCPAMTYGTHKRMVELALADLDRRGLAETVAVRLPGIVARPPAPSGLKSAFLSDLFHADPAAGAFACPVSADGTTWLMSVERCVDNLVHAMTADLSALPAERAVNLPALRVRIGDLVAALGLRAVHAADPALERAFASHPPLVAEAAEAAGFGRDEDIPALIARVRRQDR